MIAAAGYLQKIVLQICEATLIPSTAAVLWSVTVVNEGFIVISLTH